MTGIKGKRRTCCPVCGGTIVVSDLCQYSLDYEIGKRGKLKQRGRRRDCGSMEVQIAGCANCGYNWDADSFYIENDMFFDLKGEDEE